ncbi:Hypothetical predicted protein [Mytilus galloprovincialis]|uniref:B box-type domain-containing protein n=1 Tax=Mytilus galloprovincialis TaxID=29158 RepID=A0A8B6BLP3_MYTGA|nr:Hypothetical predicted protein [Mytilus galloprovincialis]
MASKYANCQFCEESADVNWHCKSCDLNLCDLCNTKIHTKSEKLSEHTVDPVKHSSETIKDLENLCKVDLKKIACSKHIDQRCVTYCLNCDKSLCSSCLIKPFQYEELNKVYEEKYLLLKNLKSKIDDCYPFFEEKAANFRKRDDDEVKQHNEMKEKIFKRKSEVKDAVTKEALALVEVMKGIWDTDNNPVKSERERLCQVEQDLKARKKILDKVTQTQEPALVFSSAEKVSTDIPEKSVLEAKTPELYYIESKEDMEKVLGSIIRKPRVVLIKTFEVDFPEISGLVSLNDDICVMYNKEHRRFKYFTISDLKFVTTKSDVVDESKKDRHSYVNIMDITSYNEEVILSDDTFQMRRLKNNGTFDNILPSFTKDKLIFYGIHATNNYEIIVGFTNKGMNSTGILELTDIDYSKNKYVIRRVECDKRSFKQLFTVPIKITTDTNGDIFVIDEEDNSRSVVSIGKWGQPKWTYIGHKSLNPVSAAALESEDDDEEEEERQEQEEDFYPNDIVTTSSGLVLVSEEETNAIHVLSNDGQFICNCLSDSEIIAPVSICFNNKGQLMIGCSDSGETKLHIVNFYE